jgi:methionyl-tRNA formyltransferase
MQISIGVICSFGQIIPSNILNLFPYGILNIHPSLLPKYRGASPIASAILSGDKVTGYTVILARAGLDTGPVVGQKQVSISSSDDHESLKRKIMSEVQHDLPQIISNYLTGVTKPKPQKIKGVTYTKKFKKTDGEISNADDAVSADRKIRAFSRWPKAYLMLGGKRLIVHSAHLNKNKLALDQIQLEGKRVMDFADFRRGYPNLLTKMPKFVSLL